MAPSISITSTRLPGANVLTPSNGRAVHSSPPSRIEPPPSGWISFTTTPLLPTTWAEPVFSTPVWCTLRTSSGRIASSIAAAVISATVICSQNGPNVATTPPAHRAGGEHQQGEVQQGELHQTQDCGQANQAAQALSRIQSIICQLYPRRGLKQALAPLDAWRLRGLR